MRLLLLLIFLFVSCNRNSFVPDSTNGISGCTDESACNYNSDATDENGSCTYTDGICETCENGQIVDNDSDGDNVCNECADSTCWNLDYDGILNNYNDYQNNGSITSAVFMDIVNVVSIGDVLAAFVNNELRGVAIPTEVPFGSYEGSYQFLTLVYSNVSSGETITYKFYDSDIDTIYDIIETTPWVSDMTLGTVLNPVILNLDN